MKRGWIQANNYYSPTRLNIKCQLIPSSAQFQTLMRECKLRTREIGRFMTRPTPRLFSAPPVLSSHASHFSCPASTPFRFTSMASSKTKTKHSNVLASFTKNHPRPPRLPLPHLFRNPTHRPPPASLPKRPLSQKTMGRRQLFCALAARGRRDGVATHGGPSAG